MSSYPTAPFLRPALAPAILACLVLVAGVALVGSDGYLWILFAVSILAAIVAVFAWQARAFVWVGAMVPIVVAWNPILPLPFEGIAWLVAHFVAAFVFLAAGVLVKVDNPEARNRPRPDSERGGRRGSGGPRR